MASLLMGQEILSFNNLTISYWSLCSPCSNRSRSSVVHKTLDHGWSTIGPKNHSFFSLQSICRVRILVRVQLKDNTADGPWLNEKLPLSVIHNRGDMVVGKYKIIDILGQGGVGTTFEAETEDGDRVALKAMSMRNMKGWKDLDLFEREARILKSLRHRGIPEYIDFFEVDSKTDRAFYIAQKVAKGNSLAELVQSGWRVTEQEVRQIAIQILEVLHYLGSLRPPVIHRDIKPENIILDKDSGTIKVVDFGAVQEAASVALFGSTIVGTYGYMAPEQFQNRATLQSDLYGLGGTILYLLSGLTPSAFPQKRLKIQFRELATMNPELANIIERLLEPAPEDRFQSAKEVIDALTRENDYCQQRGIIGSYDNGTETQVNSKRISRQPLGTKVSLKRTNSKLGVKIPPVGLTTETIGSGTFALAWNAFLLFWTGSALSGGASLFFTLFSLPFWFVGFRLAKSTVSNLTVSVDMEFGSSDFYIQWSVGNFFKQRVNGQIKDIVSVSLVVEGEQNGQVITACQVQEGVKMHRFGSGLEDVEINWLVQEIRDFLGLGPPRLGKAFKQII